MVTIVVFVAARQEGATGLYRSVVNGDTETVRTWPLQQVQVSPTSLVRDCANNVLWHQADTTAQRSRGEHGLCAAGFFLSCSRT